jgi:hypothetical protein
VGINTASASREGMVGGGKSTREISGAGGATSQKTAFFIVTAVKTSNLTILKWILER